MILDRLKRATWMRLDLLDRWLLKELLGPLLFFIALFTLLLLTGGVMFELVRQMVDKNLPITVAAKVLLFSIPLRVIMCFKISGTAPTFIRESSRFAQPSPQRSTLPTRFDTTKRSP